MLLTRAVLHITGGGVAVTGLGDHSNWFLVPGVFLIVIGLLVDWFGKSDHGVN